MMCYFTRGKRLGIASIITNKHPNFYVNSISGITPLIHEEKVFRGTISNIEPYQRTIIQCLYAIKLHSGVYRSMS